LSNFTDLEQLYGQHEHLLEDFWGRRKNRPRFERHFYLFGRLVQVLSNDERVLAAVSLSRLLYSKARPVGGKGFTIHLIVRPAAQEPGPPPEDLFEHIQYSGYGEWLALHIGRWGHAFVDLGAGTAVAILTPELAARPDIVSRGLLNTMLNNLLTGSGFSMLHATGLVREGGRALLLMAPHNSGKSTTALRLVLGGFKLLSDSQIYLSPDHETLCLMGFPVGMAKLRTDMVAGFPQVEPFLESERVRDEVKYRVNLRRMDPTLFCAHAVEPVAVTFCLLARNGQPASEAGPATREEVMAAVMVNSIHYDTAGAWQRNLSLISRLVDGAELYHLTIGTDAAGIVALAQELCP
jgi:hypothetical protein